MVLSRLEGDIWQTREKEIAGQLQGTWKIILFICNFAQILLQKPTFSFSLQLTDTCIYFLIIFFRLFVIMWLIRPGPIRWTLGEMPVAAQAVVLVEAAAGNLCARIMLVPEDPSRTIKWRCVCVCMCVCVCVCALFFCAYPCHRGGAHASEHRVYSLHAPPRWRNRNEPLELKWGGKTMSCSIFRASRLNNSSADVSFGTNIARCPRHGVRNVYVTNT